MKKKPKRFKMIVIVLSILAALSAIIYAAAPKNPPSPAPASAPASAPAPAIAQIPPPAAAPADAHVHSPSCAHSQQPPETRVGFADSLKKSFRIEPCCASELETCAKQKPNCTIAPRLVSFVDWLDSLGRMRRITEDKITEMLHGRYAMFTDTKRFTADPQGWPVIGDRNAPTTVIKYFSATCPMCKTHFKILHHEVTAGRLKGKVKIVSKPFGPTAQNRALAAAHEMGRFTDFMLELANAGGRVDEGTIYATADRMYLDRQRFTAAMENPDLLKRVEASTAEGERNGVTHIPTYFIEGMRYTSAMDPWWVIDAFEFVAENKK